MIQKPGIDLDNWKEKVGLNKIKEVTDQVADGIKNAAQKIEDKTKPAIDTIGDKFKSITDRVDDDTMEKIKEDVKNGIVDIVKEPVDIVDDVRDAVNSAEAKAVAEVV